MSTVEMLSIIQSEGKTAENEKLFFYNIAFLYKSVLIDRKKFNIRLRRLHTRVESDVLPYTVVKCRDGY